MKPALLCLFVLCGLRLPAQDAGEMDALLETPAVSGAQAARFVLGAAGLLPDGLSGPTAEEAAWEAALERGWVRGDPGAALSLKGTSFLVMVAFGLKGGLMYSLFPGPRYAYRELLYLKIIQGRADGGSAVSGERLLHIIAQALRYSGEDGRLDAALLSAPRAVDAGEGTAEGKPEVPAGEGLSAGPEGLLPYEGEFNLE